jgi:uncharacterized protein YcbK (DUF882 family)
MSNQAQLAAFIDRLGLKHFKGKEVAEYAGRMRGRVKNSVPHESLWPAIIPTLVVANELREVIGVPLKITSAYRSPAYNAAVGGETASYHMKFMALDLIPVGESAAALALAARRLRGKTFQIPGSNSRFTFKGGVGRYPTFVHIDTRNYAADW